MAAMGCFWPDGSKGRKLLDLVAGVEHVELRIAVGAIVEGVGTVGIEVDEATDLSRDGGRRQNSALRQSVYALRLFEEFN